MYLFPELFGTSHVKCNFSTAPPSGILLFPGYFHDISSPPPSPPFGSYRIFKCYFVWFKKLSTSNFHDISRIFPGYLHGSGSPSFGIYRIFTCFSYGLESLRLRISMIFPGYFQDISRIFTWFWQPPFWDLQDIYMFFVRFRKSSTSNFQDISRIFSGYLHEPPSGFGIYRIFTCFSYGLESLRLRISRIFPGYFQDIYMVLAAPLLGFTGYLHVFRTV